MTTPAIRQALEAARDALPTVGERETRKAVAETIGADTETWPEHGNAPLAIAAAVAIRTAHTAEQRPADDGTGRTHFDYLLNALELAGQADQPADHGYGAKRQALFAYVRQLEAGEQRPTVEPDMLAVCAALGFDPTNHHNAAKCPYCTPARPAVEPVAWQWRKRLNTGNYDGKPYYCWTEWEPLVPPYMDARGLAKSDPQNYEVRALYATPPTPAAVPEANGDRQYIAGLKAGWNFGCADNANGLNKVIENRLAQIRDAATAAAQPEPPSASPCPHCDDTGDVHSVTGAWRGFCNCPIGIELRARGLPVTPPLSTPEPAHAADPWRSAIDEALVVSCLDCTSDEESPEKALARLVQWEVQVALDPAVSSEAQALVDRGKVEAAAVFPTGKLLATAYEEIGRLRREIQQAQQGGGRS